MKKSVLPYLSPSKVILTFTFLQLASISSLRAMDASDEDRWHRALKVMLDKCNFNSNDFFEQKDCDPKNQIGDHTIPIFDASKAVPDRICKMHQLNLDELEKSIISLFAASGIHPEEDPTGSTWFSFFSPSLLYEKFVNILPTLGWPSFFGSSNPSSPQISHNDPVKPSPTLFSANYAAGGTQTPQDFLDKDSMNHSLKNREIPDCEFLGLSLDGGGVRGLIIALLIKKLEDITKRPVSKLFDLIGGTSIGGIGALGLGTSKDGNTPIMRGADLADLIEKHSAEIFPQNSSYNPLVWAWDHIRQISYNRYPSGPLETLLKRYLEECTLGDALTRVFVTAVNAEDCSPRIFDSSKDQAYKMWELGLCTSAAPTFFAEHLLSSDQRYYLDGGLCKNNPALDVLKGLYEMPGFSKEKTCILSLGTGTMPIEQIPAHAGISSVGPIVSTLMETQTRSVEMTLDEVLGKKHYYRANPKIEQFISLDQLTEETKRLLKEGAESQYDVIERFAQSELVRKRLERDY